MTSSESENAKYEKQKPNCPINNCEKAATIAGESVSQGRKGQGCIIQMHRKGEHVCCEQTPYGHLFIHHDHSMTSTDCD